MIEITAERFAELIVSEHKYNRLREVIAEKANGYYPLENRDLKMIQHLLFPDTIKEVSHLARE